MLLCLSVLLFYFILGAQSGEGHTLSLNVSVYDGSLFRPSCHFGGSYSRRIGFLTSKGFGFGFGFVLEVFYLSMVISYTSLLGNTLFHFTIFLVL